MRNIKGILVSNILVKKPSEKILLTLAFKPKDRRINFNKFHINKMGDDTITLVDEHGKEIQFNIILEAREATHGLSPR